MPSARLATPLAAALIAVAALALAAPAGAATAASAPAQTGALAMPQAGQPTLNVRPEALYGRGVLISGTLGPAAARRPISIQRLDTKRAWIEITRVTAGSKGGFSTTWRANRLGRQTLRAVVATTTDPAAPARTSDTTGAGPTAFVSVYRPALSTWYGPENSSDLTACGLLMTHATLGVANRTLPCGTLVKVLYRGRTIVVPVIDRGPYGNADWDLTEGTARLLGFDGLETIGTMIVSG